MHPLKTAAFNDASCNSENKLFMQKTFHRKSEARFFAIIFFSRLVWWKTFFACFLFTHFCVLKNIAKKVFILLVWWIYFSWLKLFFILSVTTFFEYEMDISYISIYSESKNMEDCRDRRFPLRDSRFLNDGIESCSKLSYANCSKVSCIYTTYLYITYSSLSDHVLPHQRPQVIR